MDGMLPLPFYTNQQLGKSQAMTPEGFLVCMDVAISRTGTLAYAEHELQGLKGDGGVIYVERLEDEVFDDKSIASFAGKPVIITHAGGTINSTNYRDELVGVVMHPRRGEYPDDNILFADLMIYSKDAIQAIRDKSGHQVSAGYNAEYEQLAPGRARQYEIVGNHVALVETGRCGPVCSVGDSAMPTLARRRVQPHQLTRADAIRVAFRTGDEAALENALNSAGPDGLGDPVPDPTDPSPATTHNVTVNIGNPNGGSTTGAGIQPVGTDATVPPAGAVPGAPGNPAVAAAPAAAAPGVAAPAEAIPAWGMALQQDIAAIKAMLQGDDDSDEPNDGDEDQPNDAPPPAKTNDEMPDQLKMDKSKLETITTDSASTVALFQQTMARAELLAPGVRMLTMDGKATVKMTLDSLCQFRRTVLRSATADAKMAKLIGPLTDGKDFKKLPCDAVTMTFDAAAILVGSVNKQTMVAGFMPGRAPIKTPHNTTMTPAEINAANRKLHNIT